MRARLYISFAGWLGARAAALVDKGVRDAYADYASCFCSQEIKEGDDWFRRNENELDKASAAVVLLSAEGLASHWQAYELGRLRGRGVPCILLLLDVAARDLGPTAYAYLNCSILADDVLRRIIGMGFDAEGADGDMLGHRSEQEAAGQLGFRLRSLLCALQFLRQYKAVAGASKAADAERHQLMRKLVHGFRDAELGPEEISQRLSLEHVPGAVYVNLLDETPAEASPSQADPVGIRLGAGGG